MSDRDRKMMGLGTQLETEEPDDEGGYKPDRKAIEEFERKLGSSSGEKNSDQFKGDRFANLEMVPPGLKGKELEEWKKEQKRKDTEVKRRLEREDEERDLNEPYSSKYF